MKQIVFLVSVLISLRTFSLDFAGNKLISYTLWKTVTKEEIKKKMKDSHVPKSLLNPKYDVDIYDVTYKTCWHDSSCIMASGLVFVPRVVNKLMPKVVYHHGTRVQKGREKHVDGESYICLGLAVDGYLVLKPDYIGLGHGEKFHLYQQYKSLGQSSADMIYAIRELSDSLQVKTNNQLFLTGYSEGGYAAVAANKVIQESHPDLKVTATAGNSGAYDMAGVQSEVMFKTYSHPHYLPYILKGFKEVYNIVPDINKIYKAPYDSLMPIYLDGHHRLKALDDILPSVPKDMVVDSFVEAYKTDSNFLMHKALKENSLINWKPENPVQLCYCKADEQVTYKNAFVARDGMKKLGAKHVTLRNGGKKYGHYKCALFASMYTKLYFDSFRNGSKYGRKGKPGKRFLLALAKLAIKP